jgi:coiled-coil family 90 protein
MNARVAFDTHAFVKRLEAAGWSAPHAEALADAMGDIVLHSIVTKTDLREMDIGLRAEMKELSTDLRAEMKDFSTGLQSELKDMELRLTLRMAAMLVFFVAVLSALKIFT